MKTFARIILLVLVTILVIILAGGLFAPKQTVTTSSVIPATSTLFTPLVEDESELDTTRWTLQSLDGHKLLANTTINLTFSHDYIGGSAGCNTYQARYTIQPNNRLTFSEVVHTLIGCIEPEGIVEQEEEYLKALQSVTSRETEGAILSLANEQGEVLLQYQLLQKFEAHPENLPGKTWQLVAGTGLEEAVLNGSTTLRFDDNPASGTTVCGKYDFVGYQTIDDNLSIDGFRMPNGYTCSEEDATAVANYLGLLTATSQYNASATRLELYTIRGEILIFEMASQ